MLRVLIIDDDVRTLFWYKSVLREFGYHVSTAALGDDAVSTARRDEFDVVICGHRLPDLSPLEAIQQIRALRPSAAIIFVNEWGSSGAFLDARNAGATTCTTKPSIGDDLVRIVHEAVRLKDVGAAADRRPAGYAARRWADLIARGIHSPDDPRTVVAWCRAVGVARATLQNRCGAVDVTPKRSLDFMRLVRLSIHYAGEPWDLQYRLDIADLRTARALIRRAGFSADIDAIPSLDVFLPGQRLVVGEHLIGAVQSRLQHLLKG